MIALAIPRTPDEISPEWLTGALHAGGLLGAAAKVSGVTVTPLSEGVGFIGQVMRLEPVYNGDAEAAPATLIVKIPTTDPGGRELASLYGLYERELQFYRQFAGRITFRVPRCYYGDGNSQAGDYVLLLEDLARTGRLGDQIAGCDLPQATAAMRALARHHATWWQHEEALALPWLGVGVELVRGSMTQAYGPSWQRFIELFGRCFSPAVVAAIPDLGARILDLLNLYEDGPFTIAHGDYRADNLFFGGEGSGYEVAVIDWQSPNKGWAAYDVAYFICGSFSTDLRHRHEKALLGEYYDALVDGGVRGYPREQFDTDYARSLLVYLAIFVVNGATLDPANDRGRALFEAIFERLDGAIGDADALRYLA